MAWYIDQGPDSDVIISSRVRLARNLDTFPFPHRMSEKQARESAGSIVRAFQAKASREEKNYLTVELDTLSSEDQMALAEKRLISEDLARQGKHHMAIISRDESVSIMINEEDHIRVQSMRAGLDLDTAYTNAEKIAMLLEAALPVAYSGKYGFLTACPTNTGTGMRASVMAHLPGMVQGGRIRQVIESLSKMGFAVRGIYGEHSKSQGNMFQISNQLTLGLSEEDLINDLKRMLLQLIDQERSARQALYENQPLVIEDQIMRSYGTMKHARLMPTDEAVRLLSDLRLGQALGLLKEIEISHINRIQASIGPASIQKAHGQIMTSEHRDQARADIIRELLA